MWVSRGFNLRQPDYTAAVKIGLCEVVSRIGTDLGNREDAHAKPQGLSPFNGTEDFRCWHSGHGPVP